MGERTEAEKESSGEEKRMLGRRGGFWRKRGCADRGWEAAGAGGSAAARAAGGGGRVLAAAAAQYKNVGLDFV